MFWTLVVLLWMASGLIGWGMANYYVYNKSGAIADKDPRKWVLLPAFVLMGPTGIICAVIGGLIIHGESCGLGLRFK